MEFQKTFYDNEMESLALESRNGKCYYDKWRDVEMLFKEMFSHGTIGSQIEFNMCGRHGFVQKQTKTQLFNEIILVQGITSTKGQKCNIVSL